MIRYNPEHLQQVIDDGKLGMPEGKRAAELMLAEYYRIEGVIKELVRCGKEIESDNITSDSIGEVYMDGVLISD